MFEKLEELAKNNKKISDFHIRSGWPLAYRQTGEIHKIPEVLVKAQDLQDLLSTNCNEVEMKRFNETHELDSSVTLSGLRFRANFYKTIQGPAAVLRRVESVIPTMDQFDLPQVLYDIIDMHKGLVLVTGPTGSGKSTTLAAIVNEINKTRTSNIITVEDPVEFIHKDIKSIVSHREVGKQTQSFASALKAALREDPDVILVGEMRDLETVSLALTAAETGHLVFGTLHTSGAPSTINRIIDVFPPEQQAQIRAQISTSLKMVVTQRLLKTKDGQGRCGAFEVMKCTPPIQNLIRESKIHQIPSIMQTAVKEGMITMTKSLEELVKAGKIDAAAGKEH
ncbi:MAG: twitching motility protein PilT [Rickettsiales bacterium]|jgi:twitching motility protein PilT|nr:twitching motility protein PilT [Rickettsiales bacterium]|tara:strand:- start:3388 stop:4401 length:1014 start_codon:yes stop_codon:yes gene_type:complete